MQSNDDLFSTDTNPVIAAYEGFDKEQPEINTPGEIDKNSHNVMPIAGANETATDDKEDVSTDNEEDLEEEEDLEDEDEEDEEDAAYVDDAGLDANADTTADDTADDTDDEDDDDGTASALNKNSSITNADDKGGIY